MSDTSSLVSLEALGATSRAGEGRDLPAESLCVKCKKGVVMRRKEHLSVAVYCSSIGRYVPSDIVECSKFSHYKEMALYEMQDLALDIDKREGVHAKSYA